MISPPHRSCLTTLAVTIGLSLALFSEAATINWGNAPSATTINYNSAGQPLDASSYAFEFGVFGGGGPTGEPSTWRTQFNLLDSLDTPYNPTFQSFDATWIGADDTFANRQAFIWIHNMDFTATPSSEWAIITADDWIIPMDNGQQSTALEFRVTSLPQTTELFPADDTLYGGLNGTSGPGEVSTSPSGFIIQLHSFPIPEPSSALLVLTGLAFVRGHRRRG